MISLAGDDEKSQRRKDDLDLECRELAILRPLRRVASLSLACQSHRPVQNRQVEQ